MGMATLRYGFATQGKPGEEDQPEWKQDALPFDCEALRAGVGGIYEVDKASGGSVTRTVTYYPVAGAMRINSTLYYILKDHLGSASVVTDASGNILGTQRYYPFGETRLTTGTI